MSRLRLEYDRLRQSTIARNAAWVFAGQGLSLGLQAAYFILLARLLGSTEYGIFSGATALVMIVANYGSLGAGTLFLRYVSGHRDAFPRYWGLILLYTLATSIFLLPLLVLLAPAIVGPQAQRLVLPLAIAFCVCAKLTECASMVFQAFDDLRLTSALLFLANLVRLITVAVLVFTLHHIPAFGWSLASLGVALVMTLASVALVSSRFGAPRFDPALFLAKATEGFGYSLAGSTAVIYNDIDKTMLIHRGLNQANGIYSLAYRVIEFVTMPVTSIQTAARAKAFVMGHHGLSGPAELNARIRRRTVPLSLCIGALLFAVAPWLPRIVGSDFAEAVSALRWLALIPLLRAIHMSQGEALLCSGLQRYRTSAQFAAAGFNFALNLWLIPRYSWRGAAWASLLTDAALAVTNTVIVTILLKQEQRPTMS